MCRKRYSPSKKLVVTAVLALAACGVAMADERSMNWVGNDNSLSRLGGDAYAYFSQPVRGNATGTAWRQNHPNGPTQQELQAMSSSSLAASASALETPVLASIPADPSWRQSHPNGPTERELQAAGASSMAMWQVADEAGVATVQGSVAQGSNKGMSLARK